MQKGEATSVTRWRRNKPLKNYKAWSCLDHTLRREEVGSYQECRYPGFVIISCRVRVVGCDRAPVSN